MKNNENKKKRFDISKGGNSLLKPMKNIELDVINAGNRRKIYNCNEARTAPENIMV